MSTLGKIDSLIAQGAKDIFMHAKIYADLRLIDRDEIEIITVSALLRTGHMASRKGARIFVSRYYDQPESIDINEAYTRMFGYDCDIWVAPKDTAVFPLFGIPFELVMSGGLRVSYYTLLNRHKAVSSIVGNGGWKSREGKSSDYMYGTDIKPSDTKPYDGDVDLNNLSSPKSK